jgi:hypothetical protein
MKADAAKIHAGRVQENLWGMSDFAAREALSYVAINCWGQRIRKRSRHNQAWYIKARRNFGIDPESLTGSSVIRNKITDEGHRRLISASIYAVQKLPPVEKARFWLLLHRLPESWEYRERILAGSEHLEHDVPGPPPDEVDEIVERVTS